MRHYTSDELLAYLDGNDAIVDLGEVDAHLEVCADCRERLGHVQGDYARIADPGTWTAAFHSPAPARLAEYSALRRRLERENARAEDIYRWLSAHPHDTWLEHLAATPDARTAGMMRRLITAARAEEESAPRTALAILDIAEALATFIEMDDSKTGALRDLWRGRAMALMIRGDYPTALDALDTAERFLSGVAVQYDRAFIDWARASVYFEMARYRDALPLVDSALRTFRGYGDDLRETQAHVLRGGILYEQGSIDAAERAFQSLVAPLQRFGDKVTLGRVFASLGCCRLQRDDFAAVEAYGTLAMALYDEVGLDTEKVRMRWAFALAYVRRGELDEDVTALHKVAAEFRAHGAEVDAAQAELDAVEALLGQGSYTEAAHIARQLVAVFSRAEARVDLIKALTYLRDATEAESATPELVGKVKFVLTHDEQPFSVA